MTRSPRVLIADDHALIRAGVRRALEREGCTVCAEAATATEAIEAAVRERPDVCLIDVRMPGNGIHAVAEISAQVPDTNVVMLTVSSETDDLVDSITAGAIGYLLKDMDPTRLADAVRAAMAGEAPMPGTMAARLVQELRRRGRRSMLTTADGRSLRLTDREWDVVDLVADGLSTAQIAQRLFVDPVTVRRHISDVMRKTRLTSRAEVGALVRQRSRAQTP